MDEGKFRGSTIIILFKILQPYIKHTKKIIKHWGNRISILCKSHFFEKRKIGEKGTLIFKKERL